MPFRCASGDYTHNEEPTLDALLGEPIVRLVMARDRVDEDHIRQLCRRGSETVAELRRARAPARPEGSSASLVGRTLARQLQHRRLATVCGTFMKVAHYQAPVAAFVKADPHV